jgi:hypothetical protein
MGDLPHPFEPWLDLTPSEYRARALEKWRTFVAQARRSDSIAAFDGQLFHGNMTDLLLTGLLLMDSPESELEASVHQAVAITRELDPLLIYFHQVDVGPTMRRAFAARGREWEQYQVGWKLRSPYARRRHLAGPEGLIALYREYQQITDELVPRVRFDALRVDNSDGDWTRHREQILAFLSLPVVEDTNTCWLPADLAS